MATLDLEAIARAAAAAADLARPEILSRFRSVAVETKGDGSPVTEADRAAERAIRASLSAAYPDFSILGEEYGAEGSTERPRWIIDPIDGTIGFSRGIALFTTLIALLDEGGEPLVGLIDCPGLDERYVGWKGGGCWRNGVRTRVTRESDLRRAIISHGDPFCFEHAGPPAQPVGRGGHTAAGSRGGRGLPYTLPAQRQDRPALREPRPGRAAAGLPRTIRAHRELKARPGQSEGPEGFTRLRDFTTTSVALQWGEWSWGSWVVL